jgi:hypothetical protein
MRISKIINIVHGILGQPLYFRLTARHFLTRLIWPSIVPFTWSGNRVHGECDRSTGASYSYVPDSTSGLARGPCFTPFSDLYRLQNL